MSVGGVSWSEDTTLVCPVCGDENVVQLWPILSSIDQPALVEQLASTGSIGRPCGRCGNLIEPDQPILVHRADRWGSTLFAYSPMSPVVPIETSAEVGEQLATILLSNLGVTDPAHEAILVMVPRLGLPQLLARDVAADLRTPPDQLRLPADIAASYRGALKRLRQRMGYSSRGQ